MLSTGDGATSATFLVSHFGKIHKCKMTLKGHARQWENFDVAILILGSIAIPILWSIAIPILQIRKKAHAHSDELSKYSYSGHLWTLKLSKKLMCHIKLSNSWQRLSPSVTIFSKLAMTSTFGRPCRTPALSGPAGQNRQTWRFFSSKSVQQSKHQPMIE